MKGFTLVEVLLVVALFATLSGFMIPRLGRAYGNLELNSAARAVAETIETASIQAIRQRAEIHLRFDQGGESIRSLRPERHRPGTGRDGIDTLMRTYRLPEGVRIYETAGNSPAEAGELIVLAFFPNGSRTPGQICIERDFGGRRFLDVSPSLSGVTIHSKAGTEDEGSR